MNETKIYFTPAAFGPIEKTAAEYGEFTVSAFTYSTGVAALRVKNAAGHFILLPFQGQQVWRAFFLGRELTMKTAFDEPLPTRDYLSTYGGFLIHCGATAMGNPGAGDKHPLHGELPNIDYNNTYIICGNDAKGDYVIAGGEVEVRTGFSLHYTFKPEIKLYAGASVMDVTCGLKNMRQSPMEYMYLCHINFLPKDGANLVYSARPDGDSFKIFIDVPENLPEEKRGRLRAYMEAVAKDPALHHDIGAPGQIYEPEIVFDIKYAADETGYAHCMQDYGDGADYAAFMPDKLPHGIRWISRTGDEDALGMVLPATADHKGRSEAERRGMLKTLAPGARVAFKYRAGCLDKTGAAAMKAHIASITPF